MNSGDVISVLSHFECDLFDLLSNAPYVNLQKSFPEKGEKSRREQQILSCRKRVDFDDDSQRNQTQLPKCRLDFECRTFDLSDNSPYTSSVILAPEECKKNTQEQYEIVKSEPAQSPVRRTFSADGTAGASKNFECSLLRLLAYICLFSSLLYKANRVYSIIPAAAGIVNSSGAGSWKIWRALCGWRCF